MSRQPLSSGRRSAETRTARIVFVKSDLSFSFKYFHDQDGAGQSLKTWLDTEPLLVQDLFDMLLSLLLVVVLLTGAKGRIDAQIAASLVFVLIAFYLLKKDGLLKVFIWRKDYLAEVLDAINQWKSVSNPVFIDYENAQISVL